MLKCNSHKMQYYTSWWQKGLAMASMPWLLVALKHISCPINPMPSKRWENRLTKHCTAKEISFVLVVVHLRSNTRHDYECLRLACGCTRSPPWGHIAVYESLRQRRAYKTAGPIQYTVPASITDSTLPAGRVAGIGTSIILTLESEKYKAVFNIW